MKVVVLKLKVAGERLKVAVLKLKVAGERLKEVDLKWKEAGKRLKEAGLKPKKVSEILNVVVNLFKEICYLIKAKVVVMKDKNEQSQDKDGVMIWE